MDDRRSLVVAIGLGFALLAAVLAPAYAGTGALRFAPPIRIGAPAGDDWEPAAAADQDGRVFVLYKHYDVPAGPITGCGDPAGCDRRVLLQASQDGGRTFGAPLALDPGHIGYDSQIEVDPVDGATVHAAFLREAKSSIAYTRSDDGGRTWSEVVLTENLRKSADKTILAVRGRDVYIAWNAFQKMYVSASHDGGLTWSSAAVAHTAQGVLGWSLAGGGAVTPDGTAVFSWAGYERNGGATGPVNLYVTRSTDRGATWSTVLLDRSERGPDCACSGFAFYHAQLTLAVDDAGRLHALSNVSSEPLGPGRLRYRTSSDGGVTWSAGRDLSLAGPGANNVFPALATVGRDGLRVAWMDDRTGRYRVYLRASSDGGASFGDESVLSADLGAPYQSDAGFLFPYGDYFELAIDAGGGTVAAWGESGGYDGPGNVYVAREQ